MTAMPARNISVIFLLVSAVATAAGSGCTDARPADVAPTPQDRHTHEPQAAALDGRELTVLSVDSREGWEALDAALKAGGVHVLARMQPHAAIARLNDGERKALAARAPDSAIGVRSEWVAGPHGARAREWLDVIALDAPPHAPGKPLVDDLRMPEAIDVPALGDAPPSLAAPYGATFWNTSEYALGPASVMVILVDSDGSTPFTAHTLSKVPLIVVADGVRSLDVGGILADVAPTLLDLIGIDIPAGWTGRSLLLY